MRIRFSATSVFASRLPNGDVYFTFTFFHWAPFVTVEVTKLANVFYDGSAPIRFNALGLRFVHKNSVTL